ncbi:hypothetical protein BH11ACT8_BH11ACT8_35660 [soil metagenome]
MVRSLAAVAVLTTFALSGVLSGCGSDGDPAEATNTSETAAPSETDAPAGAAETPSAALDSVRADVENLAVSLESYYRGNPYPQRVAEVEATLDGAGLALSPGNSIGGYAYDADTVEFKLCIQDDAGGWATYDTRPMTLRESGESGGCPDPLP